MPYDKLDFALYLKKALKAMIYTRRNRNRKRVQKRKSFFLITSDM
jgi:hypothetical protein